MESFSSRQSTTPRLKGGRPLPLSVMPGIRYPALPATADAVVLALLYQYEQSEWWSPERLLEHQLRQAKVLVDHARRTVPFYKKPLRMAAGHKRDQLTLEAWQRLLILSRGQIQNSCEQMVSRSLPRDHGAAKWARTSGSSRDSSCAPTRGSAASA